MDEQWQMLGGWLGGVVMAIALGWHPAPALLFGWLLWFSPLGLALVVTAALAYRMVRRIR